MSLYALGPFPGPSGEAIIGSVAIVAPTMQQAMIWYWAVRKWKVEVNVFNADSSDYAVGTGYAQYNVRNNPFVSGSATPASAIELPLGFSIAGVQSFPFADPTIPLTVSLFTRPGLIDGRFGLFTSAANPVYLPIQLDVGNLQSAALNTSAVSMSIDGIPISCTDAFGFTGSVVMSPDAYW